MEIGLLGVSRTRSPDGSGTNVKLDDKDGCREATTFVHQQLVRCTSSQLALVPLRAAKSCSLDNSTGCRASRCRNTSRHPALAAQALVPSLAGHRAALQCQV